MATSSIVVQGNAAQAASAAIAAITAAGGKISSQIAGQPVRFTIKGGDSWQKRNSLYVGVAHILPGGPGQTRIEVTVKAREIEVVLTVAIVVVLAIIYVYSMGYMPTPFPVFQLMLIIVGLLGILVWAVNGFYAGLSQFPTEHLDRIVAALSPPTDRAWGSAESSPSTNTDPVEQLRKLGELRAAGVLTDAEFEAKKAELLKRI